MENEITITVIDQSGTAHTLLCPLEMGLTLKDICKAYELPMEAMCGGMAMCATCHCFILSETIHLPEKMILKRLYYQNFLLPKLPAD